MALAEALTLYKDDKSALSFKTIEVDPTAVTRIDTTSTNSAPRKIRIAHSVSGKTVKTRRHLIQVTDTRVDATSGRTAGVTVNLTIQVPDDSLITNQIVTDALANCLSLVCTQPSTPNYVISSTLQAILRGES